MNFCLLPGDNYGISMWYILEIAKKSNPIKWKELGLVIWKFTSLPYIGKYQFLTKTTIAL